MRVLISAVIVLGVLLGTGYADTPRAATGNDYQQFAEGMKVGYALGLFEGIGVAASVSGIVIHGTNVLTALNTCLTGTTVRQVEAILDKYMTDHPEEWNRSLEMISASALGAACKTQINP